MDGHNLVAVYGSRRDAEPVRDRLPCRSGLRREILQQRDLLLGERPDFTAVYNNIAEKHAVLAQRYGQQRATAGELNQRTRSCFARSVVVVIGQIRDVIDLRPALGTTGPA
jgi:hypothetical protein